MSQTITINPKYEPLRDFLTAIPTVFDHEGSEIYHLRNVIKVIKPPTAHSSTSSATTFPTASTA